MNPSPWIILLAVLAYGLVHSLLAALHVKDLFRRRFGVGAERYYRLAYNAFAMISLLPVLALVRILPDQTLYTIRPPWTLLTLAGQVAAGLLLILSLRRTDVGIFLGTRQVEDPGIEAAEELVVSGPYRWVRHPLYTGGLVFIWLAPVMTVNLLALNAGLTLYILLGARYEERKLLHKFGQAYERYRRRTPMLIPLSRRAREDEPVA